MKHLRSSRANLRNKKPADITENLSAELRMARLLNAVQKMRLNAGMTQTDLGYKLGRSQAWVNNQETNERLDHEAAVLTMDRMITAANGNLDPLRELAALRNCTLCQIEPATTGSRDIAGQVALTGRNHAEVVAESVVAMADGEITSSEYAVIHEHIDELLGAYKRLDALLKARMARKR